MATVSSSRRQRLFGLLNEFSPALKIVLMTIPLSIFDFGTDVYSTKKYLTSAVDIVQIVGALLLVVLIIHNCIATFYGLSILIRQPDTYPRLWKTKLRRCCTFLLHLLGLGSLVFHLDYLADLISYNVSLQKWRHGRRRSKERDEVEDLPKPFPIWKERHLESLQLIQAFVEAFPQFILQTAALFISWTNGTETQCFPSKIVVLNDKSSKISPCVHACGYAWLRACVHACVSACVCACVSVDKTKQNMQIHNSGVTLRSLSCQN